MKRFFTPIALYYFKFFARIRLKRMKPVVIGIGGASGKSSLSDLTAKILSQKFRVLQSKGKNSETGIPLTILGIKMKDYSLASWLKAALSAPLTVLRKGQYDYFVCEMGIDSPNPPKNMRYLLSIVKPNIACLTNIDIEHSVYFDDLVSESDSKSRKNQILKLLALEEGLLLKSVETGGRVIINQDDPNIKKLMPFASNQVTLSAKDKSVDFYISNTRSSLSDFEMDLVFLKEKYNIRINRPLPKYYGYTFAQALAIAFSCGIKLMDAKKYLEENFELPPGRFSVFRGVKDTIVLDSSYNSSLFPAKGAIEVLSDVASDRRRVAILGDMRELGSLSELQHEELAKVILKNLDFVILIGPQMCEFVAPILEEAKFEFAAFQTYKEAKEKILNLVHQKDLVLVKGSQNTLFLERAVEMLLRDREDAKLLPRRESYWNKLRN